jgi:hypothetical protein
MRFISASGSGFSLPNFSLVVRAEAGADIQGGVAPIGAIFGEDPIESAVLGDVCCVSLF